MSANQILIMQENADSEFAIKTVTPEAGKVLGFDSGLNPAMVTAGGGETANVEALTADKTLTATDAPIQMYTCTANRTIDLPTTGLTVGQKFEIWNKNVYSSDYYLTVKQSSTVLYRVVARIKIELRWDGTNWIIEFSENISIGHYAYSNNTYGVGIGHRAYSNSNYGVGIGYYAYSNNTYGVGIGYYAYNNTAFGVGIGYYAYSNNNYGVGIGYNACSNNNYGVGIGSFASSNSKNYCTVAIGAYSKAERNREIVSGSDDSSSYKSSITIQKYKYKDLTTNSGAFQQLFIDATSAVLTIIAKSVYHFKAQINAIDSVTYAVKTWTVEGAIKRDASNNTTLVGTPTKTVTSADTGTDNWDVQLTADNTAEALKVEVKHDSVNSVRFSLNIFATETRL